MHLHMNANMLKLMLYIGHMPYLFMLYYTVLILYNIYVYIIS